MLLNRKYVIFFVLIVNFFLFSKEINKPKINTMIFSLDKILYFQTGLGISYNFDINYQIFTDKYKAFLDVPLTFSLDYRFATVMSFYSGIDFLYTYQQYKNNKWTINNYNLNIEIPILIKFYPIADKEDSYWFFYLGIGNVVRFWAINTFYITDGKTSFSGNSYNTDNPLMYPSNIYTPVNIGLLATIGNVLKVQNNTGIGVEMCLKYYFIPFINGYYTKPEFVDENGNVVLHFLGNIGIRLFLNFALNN